jgi:hypothetical protein
MAGGDTVRMHITLIHRGLEGAGENLVLLTEYAKSQHVVPETVRKWIMQRRIVGYKIKGRWFVDPESRFRVPLYDRSFR